MDDFGQDMPASLPTGWWYPQTWMKDFASTLSWLAPSVEHWKLEFAGIPIQVTDSSLWRYRYQQTSGREGIAVSSIMRVPMGLQGLEVSAQGLGCMGMSVGYGPPKTQVEVIPCAVEQGVTFLYTVDAYGPFLNEVLVGKAIIGIRHKVQLATKFGNIFVDGKFSERGDPEYVRAACEKSLERLGVEYIDFYYQHRVDRKVPIEITVGAMKELVKEGKVKYLGLSEASAADIRRAHAMHPITVVQVVKVMEYSLWSRDIEEDILCTCRELGIGVVVYSPLGQGFFGGYKSPKADDYDYRLTLPRFQGENPGKNEELRARVQEIPYTKNCSLSQLALAWVHLHGKDLVPIPGTTKRTNLESNIDALRVSLIKQEMENLEAAVPVEKVSGERYPDYLLEKTFRFVTSSPLESYKAM